jgi:hypothetical protein
MNIGLTALVLHPKNWRTELAFIASIIGSSIVCIIAIPTLTYASGTIVCAALYGVVSLCYGLEQRFGYHKK